jgi:flagellar secretion chaperone FliS
MSTSIQRAVKSYADLGVETGVASASPQELIVMLYDGAIQSLRAAKIGIMNRQAAEKGKQISKAISIIDEGLRSALDVEAGGDIAKNLMDLYDYMSNRLMLANLKNDIKMIDEVAKLLIELKGAWEALGATEKRAQPPERRSLQAREAMSFGKV